MAASRLQDAGQRLQDGLSSVDLETSGLLGSGWKGDAASAFGKAWEQWHSGAGQVVRGLQTMSELLNVAGKEYAKIDEQAADALGSTMEGGGSSVGSDGGAGGRGGGGSATDSVSSQGGAGSTDSRGGTGSADGLAQQVPQMMQSMTQMGQTATQAVGQITQSLAQSAQMATELVQQAGSDDEGAHESADEQDDTDQAESDIRDGGTTRADRVGEGSAGFPEDSTAPTAPVEAAKPSPPTSLGGVERPRSWDN